MTLNANHENGMVSETVSYLESGIKFGLFEAGSRSGGKYYFENGINVKTETLWEAIRAVHNLSHNHGKTLKELCPNYVGEFKHRVGAHMWKENKRRRLRFF